MVHMLMSAANRSLVGELPTVKQLVTSEWLEKASGITLLYNHVFCTSCLLPHCDTWMLLKEKRNVLINGDYVK